MEKITKQQYAAYKKGQLAYEMYGEAAICPYKDKRTDNGRNITFSRAFMRRWYEGVKIVN